MTELDIIQEQHKSWAKRNFPDAEPWQGLLGAMEELGELCHAHLKAHQGIREVDDPNSAKRDAIGDIVIYLMHYCSINGWWMSDIIDKTWSEVKRRDWIKYPKNGVTE